MSDRTARLGLPFILPGQAQKELFHNEALTLVDAALHPAVESDALAGFAFDREGRGRSLGL